VAGLHFPYLPTPDEVLALGMNNVFPRSLDDVDERAPPGRLVTGLPTKGDGMAGLRGEFLLRAVLTLHLPDVTTARSNAMAEPKNAPAPSRPRQLPGALKGPAHRDRRRANTKVYDLYVEEARETRPQPSLPPVRWLSRKDVD